MNAMKKTVFEAPYRLELIGRVKNLIPDSKGKWGRLNSQQMVRHLSEACRMAFDEVQVPDQSNFLTRTMVKWLFLSNVKPPGREKGKIKTFPPIDIVERNISVSDMETEIKNYSALLDRMNNANILSNKHPLFGKMSREDWGYLTYAHGDYHLTQFNV